MFLPLGELNFIFIEITGRCWCRKSCAGGGFFFFRRFCPGWKIFALALAIWPHDFGVSKGKTVPGKEADDMKG